MLYLIAILPSVVITILILKFDKYEKEPVKLLLLLFGAGMISVIPAALIESAVPLSAFGYGKSLISVLLYALLGIALIEEGVKFLCVKIISYKRPSYNEIYDGLIYCVMVSLGFATVENIMYVMQYGAQTALLRAVTAVPAHAIFALVMGFYMSLGKAFPANRKFNKIMSIVAPVFIHGVYDFILMSENGFLLLFFIPYLVFLYFRAIRLVKTTHNAAPFE